MRIRFARRFALFTLVFAAVFLPACDAIPSTNSKPSVIIAAPPSGSTFREGDEVAIQSSSADKSGVVRVELNIDGTVVRSDAPPSPQLNFSLIQTWKATLGSHIIVVRAYNATGSASEPAAITITVNPGTSNSSSSSSVASSSTASSSVATSSAASSPVVSTTTSSSSAASSSTGAPPATSSSVVSSVASTCTDNAAFDSDLTIPDGTTLNAGQTFDKKWRIKNNGNCPWGAGYQLVFAAGEAMTNSTFVAVPPTSPGSTADISVPMAAPATPGGHSGSWKMRNTNGISFGQALSVKINVPAPPASSAASSASSSAATCSGAPNVPSFTASPVSIGLGGHSTLNWGAVTNADSVEIDALGGGVATPGTATVSPSATTTYTIIARCGSNIVSKTATVTVVAVSSTLTSVTSINPAIFFHLTSVTANATTSGANNYCGTKVYTFKGTINTGGIGNGTVNSQWFKSPDNAVGSDVAASPSNFSGVSGGSSLTPQFDYKPSNSDNNGYMYLHIFSPTVMNSNLVSYSCTKTLNIITSFSFFTISP